jgi:hypothetical protein
MNRSDETGVPPDDAARAVGQVHPRPEDKGGDGGGRSLEERVVRAAEAALAHQQFVGPVDVLLGLGWLPASRLKAWRLGRVDVLERAVGVNLHKLNDAMEIFSRWARARALLPRETAYVSQTRDRRTLRFSASGNPAIERAYRTHWVSPELTERKRERLALKRDAPPQLVVVSPLHAWTCARCGETGSLLFLEDDKPLCLQCAGLAHLVFLPAGDAKLTRRTQAASSLSAVVVRFSRTRKRYERQGLLVEQAALDQVRAAIEAAQGERG